MRGRQKCRFGDIHGLRGASTGTAVDRHVCAKIGFWYDLRLSRRLRDQIRDRVGLRYEGNVACFHLDRLRAHALRHEAFEIGINRTVFRGDGIPARL